MALSQTWRTPDLPSIHQLPDAQPAAAAAVCSLTHQIARLLFGTVKGGAEGLGSGPAPTEDPVSKGRHGMLALGLQAQ